MSRDTLRLVLIGSTMLAALGSAYFGIPRLRLWLTPDLQRVWVVSAALGDEVAGSGPREVLSGTPVTLFAIVEAGGGDYFGTVARARLGERLVDVEPWSSWWYPLEFLWFKVEPLYAFANEDQSAAFAAEDIRYHENFMLGWGFGPRAAADVQPTGDLFPKLEVGTMRFKVRAVVRDAADRILDEALSPGAESIFATDPSARPLRLSVRAADSAVGELQAWSGLPYVPILAELPPAAHPATHFLGGTILDFWVAALRRRGRSDLPFMGWQRLPEYAETAVDEMFLANDGNYYWTHDPLRPVGWETVRVGDLLAIDDHVGVLYQDRGPAGAGDGILNQWDRLLGGYFEPLRDMPLGDAFVSGVTVYRLPMPEEDGA